MDEPAPQLTAHEVGYRVGEPQQHALGTMIQICWWQQRPMGSDIWYERTSQRVSWEFKDVCVPITPTYLPQPPRRKQRVIAWEDTVVGDKRGVNTRRALDEAMTRGQLRHDAVLFHGHTIPMTASCSACHRYRDVAWCVRCNHWHHQQCVGFACGVASEGNTAIDATRMASLQYTWEASGPNPSYQQAGDGSVINAASPAVSGGWALHDPLGRVFLGKLHVHRHDITSTRCEVHGLIAGLILGGDAGTQICDNTSAISILQTARVIAETGNDRLSYSNSHRMEIRSLSKLMHPDGTFNAKWVRSHQESKGATDDVLQSNRDSLAIADNMAKRSHTTRMRESYSGWVDLETWMVLDEEGRLVFGNTLRYMFQRAYASSKREWLQKEQTKREHRQVLLQTDISMVLGGGWDKALQRFYWRAKTSTLHTNAIKHRMDSRWPAACSTCGCENDTQDHRFGLDDSLHVCDGLDDLTIATRRMHHKLESTMWHPDQALFIPALGQEIATLLRLPVRPLWSDAASNRMVWSVMVQLAGDLWVHAQLLEWLGLPTNATQRNLHTRILRIESQQPKFPPSGRLLPFYMTSVVQMLHGAVGIYDAHLSQWTPGWAGATLTHLADARSVAGLCGLSQAESIRVWWVDDIYIVRSEGWWEDFQHDAALGLRSAKTYWICTFENSIGYDIADSIDVLWVLRVPAGQLKMRTDYSVVQPHSQPHKKHMFTRNARTIWIGVVGLDSDASVSCYSVWSIWRTMLSQCYSEEWLLSTAISTTECAVPWRHPLLDLGLPGLSHGELTPPWWRLIRQQLHRLGLAVFESPKGWRRYPTMSRDTLRWVEAISSTRLGAKRLHVQFVRRTWETLRDYWNGICIQVRQERENSDIATLWRDVNSGIRRRRQGWARSTLASTSRFLDRRHQDLQRRGSLWHRLRQDHPDESE